MLLEQHPNLVLVAMAACLLVPRLGSSDLHLWDEVFYASRAVVAGHDGHWWDQSQTAIGGTWTGFHPPLVIWLMALAGQVAGFGEWTLRAPIALHGLLAVVVLRPFVLRLTHSPQAATLAGAALVLTPLFTRYARRCQLDVPVMFWIMLSLFCFQRALRGGTRWAVLAGFAFGLALFAKLAVGFLVPLSIAVFLGWEYLRGSRGIARRGLWLLGLLGVIGVLVAAPWFIGMTLRYGSAYWEQSIGYHAIARLTREVEGHSTSLGIFYYPMQAIVWMATLAPFVVLGMRGNAIRSLPSEERRFLWSWLLTPLVLFSLSSSKTTTYLLIFLPALAAFAGLGLANWLARGPSRAELAATLTATVAAIVWAQTTPLHIALESAAGTWGRLRPAPLPTVSLLGAFFAMLLVLGLGLRALVWRMTDPARARLARWSFGALVFVPVVLMALRPSVSGGTIWIRLRSEVLHSTCRRVAFEGVDDPTNRLNLSLLETRGVRVTWGSPPRGQADAPCRVLRTTSGASAR